MKFDPQSSAASTLRKKSSKEKIERPSDEPVISGPLDVSLALDSEWKRRYITVVGDGLYIWTNHK